MIRLPIDQVLTASATPAESAWTAALRTARESGVRIHELEAMEEFDAAIDLCNSIWRPATPPATRELLRAIAKSGGYIAGAYDGAELVATSFGFFSAPGSRALHSHIAGVSGRVRGRGVGFALKVHQRAWALSRGVRTISWTFDPLVKRNAHFNLNKLEAVVREYLPNFYGSMSDEINTADSSDRLLATWDLLSPAVSSAVTGSPTRTERAALDGTVRLAVGIGISETLSPMPGSLDGEVIRIAIPEDIESLRLGDPGLASQWRKAVRDSLGVLMAEGARSVLFDRALGYIVTR